MQSSMSEHWLKNGSSIALWISGFIHRFSFALFCRCHGWTPTTCPCDFFLPYSGPLPFVHLQTISIGFVFLFKDPTFHCNLFFYLSITLSSFTRETNISPLRWNPCITSYININTFWVKIFNSPYTFSVTSVNIFFPSRPCNFYSQSYFAWMSFIRLESKFGFTFEYCEGECVWWESILSPMKAFMWVTVVLNCNLIAYKFSYRQTRTIHKR